MIVIILVTSIFYAIVITFLLITWYKDVKHNDDTDKRIQVLEKRDADKVSKKSYDKRINYLYECGQQQDIIIESLLRRVEKLERKHISKDS